MKKRFTFTLDPKVCKAARILAVELDTNLSAMIEKLLKDFLEKQKSEVQNENN